jgi:hypothetical protein
VHHVERAELLVGLGEQALDLIGQGGVAAEGEAVDLGAEGLELLRPAGGEPHLDPVPRQDSGEGRADAFTHPDDQSRSGHGPPLPRRAPRGTLPASLAPDLDHPREVSSTSGATVFGGAPIRHESRAFHARH